MKIYVVKHYYGEYVGHGECAYNDEVVFVTNNREDAEKWVEKWNHPFVYDAPYSDLDCYNFYIEEMDVLEHVDVSTPPTKFEDFHDPNFDNLGRCDIYDENKDTSYDKLVAICERQKKEEEEREYNHMVEMCLHIERYEEE